MDRAGSIACSSARCNCNRIKLFKGNFGEFLDKGGTVTMRLILLREKYERLLPLKSWIEIRKDFNTWNVQKLNSSASLFMKLQMLLHRQSIINIPLDCKRE